MSRPACAQSGKSSDGVSSKVAQKSAPGSGTAASLAQAISFGVPGLVKAELRAGAPVNAVGNGKEGPLLPLWRAVWIGNPAIVQLLVDQGADVGFADENGRTALHIVRLAPEIIAILVAKGADVNARDNDGNTPLHLSEPPITDALLAAGADVNVKNVKGETPIVTILKKQFTAEAVGYEPTCIIGEPALRQLSALVAAKADLSAPDEDGNTALSIGQKIQTSCKHFTETKDPSTMARILKLGPPGPRTATHLVCAVESKDMARVKAELDDGAPVNAVGTGCENLEGVEDWTPLGMAAHLGDLSLVKFLIDHGADAKILAPNNASNGLFKVSVLNFVRKDPEIVKLLIAQGANPNAKGSEYPALSAVAMNTDNDDVQVRIRLVSALLAGGAEVDAKDSAGDTALTSSVQMYSGELCSNLESELPLISALLAAKADPTIVNINGDTARSVAQKQQSECDDPAGKAATAKLINMLNGPIPGK
jgi:ankyrin repeat protein